MAALSEPSDDPPILELQAEPEAPAAATKIRCPYCGVEHDKEQQGRFCDGCGLSIAPPPRLAFSGGKPQDKDEALRQRLCAMCGSPLRGGKCPSCG